MPTRYEPFSGPCAIANASTGAKLTMHTHSLFIALARHLYAVPRWLMGRHRVRIALITML